MNWNIIGNGYSFAVLIQQIHIRKVGNAVLDIHSDNINGLVEQLIWILGVIYSGIDEIMKNWGGLYYLR